MSIRLIKLGAVVCCVVLVSCTDSIPTTPLVDAQASKARVVGSRRPTLFKNAIKYRDSGKKPATGRSGNASLVAQALLGRDGVATLDVTSGVLGQPPYGSLTKVQVKEFDATGKAQIVSNHNAVTGATARFKLASPIHGGTLQVQASITNVDGNRTDVVTVTETVKFRPDIAAVALSHTAQAVRGAVTIIGATFRELKQDIGARANCVLSIDGTAVDQAQSIWIDAGGEVSCQFLYRFTETGEHRLVVSADGVDPGDYDVSNNSRASTITITDLVPVPGPNDFTWEATIFGNQNLRGFLFAEGFSLNSQTNERQEFRNVTELKQQDFFVADIGGRSPRSLSGPISVTFQDRVDGTTLRDDAFDEVTDQRLTFDQGTLHQDCSILMRSQEVVGEMGPFLLGLASLAVCSSTDAGVELGTFFSYFASGGQTVYYADSFFHLVSPEFEDTFSFTGDISYLFGAYAFGSEYAFELVFTAGDQRLAASGVIPIVSRDVHSVFPLECVDFEFEEFSGHQCTQTDITYRDFSGSATGAPMP